MKGTVKLAVILLLFSVVIPTFEVVRNAGAETEEEEASRLRRARLSERRKMREQEREQEKVEQEKAQKKFDYANMSSEDWAVIANANWKFVSDAVPAWGGGTVSKYYFDTNYVRSGENTVVFWVKSATSGSNKYTKVEGMLRGRPENARYGYNEFYKRLGYYEFSTAGKKLDADNDPSEYWISAHNDEGVLDMAIIAGINQAR